MLYSARFVLTNVQDSCDAVGKIYCCKSCTVQCKILVQPNPCKDSCKIWNKIFQQFLQDLYVSVHITCKNASYLQVLQDFMQDNKFSWIKSFKFLQVLSSWVVSLYNNVPFILECFHDQQDSQWREKASQKYQTKNSQNGPNVFLSSSLFFRRASLILCEPLTLVYTRNSSILYEAVHNPIAFSQLQSFARHL